MRVRLTTKLAEVVNGVDLSRRTEGDVLDLSPRDAAMLVAEGWGEAVSDEVRWRPDARAVAADRPRRRRSSRRARTPRPPSSDPAPRGCHGW